MYAYELWSILLIQSCAMDKCWGPIAFAGFGAAENEGIAFGWFQPRHSHGSLLHRGASLRGRIALCLFLAAFLCLTAFLLLIPEFAYTRVLTIAHMYMSCDVYVHAFMHAPTGRSMPIQVARILFHFPRWLWRGFSVAELTRAG